MATASDMAAQAANLYTGEGPGRLVVKFTFLNYVGDEDDEQPTITRRCQTDSVLCEPGHGAMACLEYLPGSPIGDTAAAAAAVAATHEEDGASTAATSTAEAEVLTDHGDDSAGVADRGHRSGAATATGGEPHSAWAEGGAAAAPAGSSSTGVAGSCTVERKKDNRSTLMMRNLPNDYTRGMLLDLLDAHGFAGKYDFVYLPCDFTRGCGLGYAFVNLVDVALVPSFIVAFNGFSRWSVCSGKVCHVTWSDRDQGLRANVRRYRNSPVMHDCVKDEWKPILFSEGVRIPFPKAHGRLPRPNPRRA